MKKTDLLKPGGIRQQQLLSLAREINEREQALLMLREKTIEHASSWICEVMLQGQSLLKVKASLTHGMWLEWLQIHCPLLSIRTAQRYMQLSTSNRPEMSQAASLRSALSLCDETESSKLNESHLAKAWPPYLEALGRVAKFVGYVERFPLVQWPDEGRDKLRSDLLPVAMILWPDRFR